MKKLLFAMAMVSSLTIFAAKEVKVEVSNPSSFDRVAQSVEVDYTLLSKKLSLAENDKVIVLNQAGEEIPSQILFKGGKKPLALLFQVDIKGGQTIKSVIKKGTPSAYPALCFSRFVPERKDDYAWENDRLAFRVYGKSLIPIDGPSNGIDVFAKRTTDNVINKWYKLAVEQNLDYHTDRGQGHDFYKVGRTLGGGGAAPYVKDTLVLGKNFYDYKILDNGPLRTSFILIYDTLWVEGQPLMETKEISLDAGSQFSKISVRYQGITQPLSVASGIVKRPDGDNILLSPTKDYAIYHQPADPEGGFLHLGLVLPEANTVTVAHGHVLMIGQCFPTEPMVYYTGAGWEKWGFDKDELWNDYVKQFAQEVQQPLRVTVK